MQQEATVKELISAQEAQIEVRRKAACGSDCDSCHGCTHPDATITVSAFNEVHAEVGDRVLVESSSGQVLSLAALLYIMPIVLMIGGYFLSSGTEGIRVLIALGAMLLGLVFCFFFSRRMKKKGKMTFRITQIL